MASGEGGKAPVDWPHGMTVSGELVTIELNGETIGKIRDIERLEGYYPEGSNSFYKRVLVRVMEGKRSVLAWTYVMPLEACSGYKPISGGSWG
jgi:gamma-glutamylcyclotransferase (GGCT)/AIG2-like uncharacterized protein YtfP